MTTPASTPRNPFLAGPLGPLFLRTAAPIVFVMGMNGLLTIVDAWFLGVFVGAEALSAVTLMFPVYMMTVALTTVVSIGMASVLARRLGAHDIEGARAVLSGAHGLALVMCAILIAGFLLAGRGLVDGLANGSPALSAMGHTYIAILVYASPISFLLAVNYDAFRCEGRVSLMAAMSLGVSLMNIALNYLLIVVLDLGVAGSAGGTVAAQAVALAIVLTLRARLDTPLPLSGLSLNAMTRSWPEFLALGAPQSLSFLGISLGSTAIIYANQLWNAVSYADTVAAYGIALRILTFAFLPLMGLNQAMQTIVGNNFGAGLLRRVDDGLRLAALAALVYCASVQLILFLASGRIGYVFVDDPATAGELARILPVMTAAYFLAGPILVLSGYYQAIGDAPRAALLSLTRTYASAIPLTFVLPTLVGERGIWMAGPTSEWLMLGLAALLLAHGRRSAGLRWGVFRAPA